jgi:hypothetical protein
MILIGSIQIITVKTLIIEVITNYFKQTRYLTMKFSPFLRIILQTF